ncbi:MAG TPA: hypothetical protein VFG43_03670 [Geminicoccaceae bacterium]|nr:hypothetical protein [Geminicoccaceae bacterium]
MSVAEPGGPRRPAGGRDRSIGLFLLGVVAFSPALLRIFGGEADLFGWPLLWLYLFGAWGGLILLLALHVEGRRGLRQERQGDAGDGR